MRNFSVHSIREFCIIFIVQTIRPLDQITCEKHADQGSGDSSIYLLCPYHDGGSTNQISLFPKFNHFSENGTNYLMIHQKFMLTRVEFLCQEEGLLILMYMCSLKVSISTPAQKDDPYLTLCNYQFNNNNTYTNCIPFIQLSYARVLCTTWHNCSNPRVWLCQTRLK